MILSVQTMLFWLPATFLTYLLLPQRLRPHWLLFCSTLNLWLLDTSSAIVAFLSTIFTYGCALAIKLSSDRWRHFWLTVGIAVISSLILISRDGSEFVCGVSIKSIGLGFFGLMYIGFLIDLATDKSLKIPRLTTFSLAGIFFPYVSAGPIVKISKVTGEFKKGLLPSRATIWVNIKRVLYGAFCKLVIADRLSEQIAFLMDTDDQIHLTAILAVAVGYSIQIYFDFMGYSEIARGVAGLFGIPVPANFNHPYLATNTKEFWKRWHISLTSWFREYLYLPLGGSKALYFPLLISLVFLVSSIWHGLRLNFLLWGLMHALGYLWSVYGTSFDVRPWAVNVFDGIKKLVFFLWLSATWLIFRTEDINGLFQSVSVDGKFELMHVYDPFIIMLSVSLSALMIDHSGFPERTICHRPVGARRTVQELVFVDFLILGLLAFAPGGHTDFIYFNF